MLRAGTVLFVVNPTSGGGKAARWVGRVADVFRQAGWQTDCVLTRRAGEGLEAARSCAETGTVVLAFGGDGTVNEVLNGADLARCILGVIPAGTGNVLAKELGVLWHPVRAARQLLAGRVTRLDMGECNGRRFLCVFGAGVDAAVVRQVHQCRGRAMSQWRYVPHAIAHALWPERWSVDVSLEGKPFARHVQQVVVGNSHSYGGPIEMTPAASANDGLFDVMCTRFCGPVDLVGKAACSFLRRLDMARGVRYGRGRQVLVTAASGDVPYEVDGEAAGSLPAAVEIRPAAVRLLVPASFRPVARQLPDERICENAFL
jgi:YegS/Rv2252/BmrU family lipid kinase